MFVCGECGELSPRPGACAVDGGRLVATDHTLGTDVARYRIARKLGQGGMGAVYLGILPSIGSRVAIKILSDQCADDPDLVDRFFAEARAVNLIRHENIVDVLDLGQLPDGRPYLVMELIDGQTLGHIVRRTHASLGGIASVASEILSALEAAHAIGIVHRDLKPDNVLITAKGHAKVLDFGIAKLARNQHEHARTQTGALLGTPAYMSPEQVANAASVDGRSDIYAAGVVLFEAVTGRLPFTGSTFELMRAHAEDPPPSPRAWRPDLALAFEQVIFTALEKDPARRFQTAAQMAAALRDATSDLARDRWVTIAQVTGPAIARGTPMAGGAPSVVGTPIAPSVVTPNEPPAVGTPMGNATQATASPMSSAPGATQATVPPMSPGATQATFSPSALGATQATFSPTPAPLAIHPPAHAPAPPPAHRRLPLVIAAGAVAITIAIVIGVISRSGDDTKAERAGSGSTHGAERPVGPRRIIRQVPPTADSTLPDGPLKPYNPRAVDLVTAIVLSTALAQQASKDKDVALVEILLHPVAADGRIDLELRRVQEPDTRFVFVSRALREVGSKCLVVITFTKASTTPSIVAGDCTRPPVELPTCSLAKVVKRSIYGKSGGLTEGSITMRYVADDVSGAWHLEWSQGSIDPSEKPTPMDQYLDDNCR